MFGILGLLVVSMVAGVYAFGNHEAREALEEGNYTLEVTGYLDSETETKTVDFEVYYCNEGNNYCNEEDNETPGSSKRNHR